MPRRQGNLQQTPPLSASLAFVWPLALRLILPCYYLTSTAVPAAVHCEKVLHCMQRRNGTLYCGEEGVQA